MFCTFNWLLLLATIHIGQGLKCYQHEIKVDGVPEHSVLNYLLRGSFDAHSSANQPQSIQNCSDTEAYCAKTQCHFGNGIYADFKYCSDVAKPKYNMSYDECVSNQTTHMTCQRLMHCKLDPQMAKECNTEFCTTDLCNAAGSKALAAISMIAVILASLTLLRFA